jgi:hypothetical protein
MDTNTLQGIIDTALRAKREDKVRDSWYVSDLGRCPTAVWLERNEPKSIKQYEHDARTLRVFGMGSVIHEWIENTLKGSLHLLGSEVRCENKELGVRGRCDLIVRLGDQVFVVDIKTMNSNGFHYFENDYAKPHHAQQVMMYIDMLQETYKVKLIPAVLYVSKDDACIKWCAIDDPAKRLEEAKQFFKDLNVGKPKPVDVIQEKGKWAVNWQSKYCNCHEVCTGNPDWLKEANKRIKELN